jgi:hypothetical protein
MPSRDANKVIVVGFPKAYTDKDLSTMCDKFGPVAACSVVKDNATQESKGFGFVTFSSAKSWRACMAALNGTKLQGRLLHVRSLEKKDDHAVKAPGIPHGAPENWAEKAKKREAEEEGAVDMDGSDKRDRKMHDSVMVKKDKKKGGKRAPLALPDDMDKAGKIEEFESMEAKLDQVIEGVLAFPGNYRNKTVGLLRKARRFMRTQRNELKKSADIDEMSGDEEEPVWKKQKKEEEAGQKEKAEAKAAAAEDEDAEIEVVKAEEGGEGKAGASESESESEEEEAAGGAEEESEEESESSDDAPAPAPAVKKAKAKAKASSGSGTPAKKSKGEGKGKGSDGESTLKLKRPKSAQKRKK